MTRVLVVAAALLASGSGASAAVDCSAKFAVGPYGILPSEPAFKSGKLAVKDFAPLYLMKKPRMENESGDCHQVYPFEIFQLLHEQKPEALVAGCSGDFDGDHHKDFAMLMIRVDDGAVLPVAFVERGKAFESRILNPVVDKEFEEDPGYWPGPMCEARPRSGIFKSEFEENPVAVAGDLFSVGWYTYYWNKELKRLDRIATAD